MGAADSGRFLPRVPAFGNVIDHRQGPDTGRLFLQQGDFSGQGGFIRPSGHPVENASLGIEHDHGRQRAHPVQGSPEQPPFLAPVLQGRAGRHRHYLNVLHMAVQNAASFSLRLERRKPAGFLRAGIGGRVNHQYGTGRRNGSIRGRGSFRRSPDHGGQNRRQPDAGNDRSAPHGIQAGCYTRRIVIRL